MKINQHNEKEGRNKVRKVIVFHDMLRKSQPGKVLSITNYKNN